MAHVRLPLVADSKYASQRRVAASASWCPRLFLHAAEIGIEIAEHPEIGGEIAKHPEIGGEIAKPPNIGGAIGGGLADCEHSASVTESTTDSIEQGALPRVSAGSKAGSKGDVLGSVAGTSCELWLQLHASSPLPEDLREAVGLLEVLEQAPKYSLLAHQWAAERPPHQVLCKDD